MPLYVFRSTITPCMVLSAPALLILLALTVLRPAPAARGMESSSSQPVLEESLRSAIEAARYRVRLDQRSDAARQNYLASNPAQHFQTLFTTGETIVTPLSRNDSESSKWTLRLRLKGVGYGKRFTTVEPGEIAAKDNRVQIIHGLSLTAFSVEEWYVNTSKGIEHGFNLPNRPAGKRDGEKLRLKLELSGNLKASLRDNGQAVVLAMTDGKPVLRYEKLQAFDAQGEELEAQMELVGRELSLVVDDTSATYPLTIDPYLFEIKKLTASDGAGSDRFGQSVAIGGDTAVIGAPWDDTGSNTNQGSVYVFSRNQGGANAWGEVRKLVASDGAPESRFGWSVAISGDTLLVGAYTDSDGPQGLGSVYIFERNQGGANNWGQVKKLKAGVHAGSFGWSVAISENSNTIAVGAPAGVVGTDTGEAYVFDRNQGGANNWGQVKKLLPGDSSRFDYFAQSVSISGDTIVAGAPGADIGPNSDQGAAYIFDRNLGGANNWGLVKKQTSADGAVNDQFGTSVSISGDTLVAGAYLDDVGSKTDQGSAYIFERNLGGASNWGQQKKITALDGNDRDALGFSVAVSGDRIVVGMNNNGAAVVDAGGSFSNGGPRAAAYLFDRNQGGANNWGEFQRLRPLDQQINDYFSWSVAISGGTVVGGALVADVGANPDQGAAYIFDSVTGQNPAIKGGSVSVVQGGTTLVKAVATVSDDVTPPGNLVVSVVSSPPGITVNTNFTNRDGVIYTGSVHADCSVAVGSHLVGLRVTDGDGFTATANLTVNVTANDAPTVGDYPANTVGLGSSGEIFSSAPPGDSGGLSTFNLTASAPGFTGSFSVTKTTGMVTFTNAGPAGNHTVTVTATDTCGLFVSKTFTLSVLSQANTLTVNTTADTTANDGFCSLREAITSANTHSASGASAGECVAGVTGTDLIAFNIPGAGPHTITPASSLPTFTEPIIVDGLSQAGAACNSWPPTLKIVLNGANAGATNGLSLNTFNSTVRGLVVNQFTNSGISSSGNGNTFQCNFLGTDVTGTTRVANGTGIFFGGIGNLIGGTTPGARNLISGNGDGIFTASNNLGTTNLAQANFIGTDVTGTLDLGNTANGVHVNGGGGFGGGSNFQIGGTTPEARNIISGNDQNGVFIENATTINRPTRVFGNYIGTDVTGAARLGNGLHGVSIANANLSPVGFTSAGSGNVISANGGAGVRISGALASGNSLQGNYIGTDATGKLDLGNFSDGVWIVDSGSNNVGLSIGNTIGLNGRDGVRIEGSPSTKNNILLNSIFNNAGLGINLGVDGVTPNDLGDADIGPNNLQNFPVITSIITNGVTTNILGTLNSKPNFEYTIQFFLADGCDSSGNGEGKTWIADHVIKTDSVGVATIDASLPLTVSPGQVITATARLSDPAAASADLDGTSEFSSCLAAQGIGPQPTPASCSFSISPANQVFNAGGGTGGVNVTTAEGCGWTAVANDAWITITSGGADTASATVNYSVAANSGAARMGTMTVAGHTFTVTQAAPTPTPTPTPNQVQFSAANYNVQEDCTFVTITVTRAGDASGAASVDYHTSNITATERGDYITALGKLQFAAGETSKTFVVLINEDSYVEGDETFNVNLTNPSGVGLGAPAISTITIKDDVAEPATNVIDDSRNYVCQNYHDFLNRQPDPSGWDFWTNQITSCGTNAQCIEEKRINVSASFFLSIEFQQTGYLVERAYKTSNGDATGNSTIGGAHTLPVPIIRFREFLSDTQLITKGVIVLQPGWEQQLESNKQAFIGEFVQRSLFTTAFPTSMTPAEFVDKLNQNAGNVLSASERTTAINLFGGAANTTNATARAQALRQVAEDQDLQTGEFNRAFVLMQYIGYLRRNPNDPQDPDHSGFDFWLTKLNQFGGNYINAEMVKAFITSIEYRQRFGP